MFGALQAILNLDISGFTAGLQRAQVASKKFSTDFAANLRKAEQATQKFSTDFAANLRKSEKAARDNEAALGNMTKSMSAISKAAGLTMLAGGMYEVGKACIMATVQMQTFEVQYQAVFKGAADGAAQFDNISQFAKKFGLDLVSTADAYAKFQAATETSTMTFKEAEDAFKGISTGIVGLHLSADKAGRVFLQLQQMMSKGVVQAEELRVVAESLPGAYGLVAQAMGKTGAQLAREMRKGLIKAPEMVAALGKEMVKLYGESAVKASEMMQASMNNFNTKLFETKAALGEQLAPSFGLVLKELGFLMDGLRMFILWVQKGAVYLAHFYSIASDGIENLKGIQEQKGGFWGGIGRAVLGPVGAWMNLGNLQEAATKTMTDRSKDLADELKRVEDASGVDNWGLAKNKKTGMSEKALLDEHMNKLKLAKGTAAYIKELKRLGLDENGKKLPGAGRAARAENAALSGLKTLENLRIESEKTFNKKSLDPFAAAMSNVDEKILQVKNSLGKTLGDKRVAGKIDEVAREITENTRKGFFAGVNADIDEFISDTDTKVKAVKGSIGKTDLERGIADAQASFLNSGDMAIALKYYDKMNAAEKELFNTKKATGLESARQLEVQKKAADFAESLQNDLESTSRALKNVIVDGTMNAVEVEVTKSEQIVEDILEVMRKDFLNFSEEVQAQIEALGVKLKGVKKELVGKEILSDYNFRKRDDKEAMDIQRSGLRSRNALIDSNPFDVSAAMAKNSTGFDAGTQFDEVNKKRRLYLQLQKKNSPEGSAGFSEAVAGMKELEEYRTKIIGQKIEMFDLENLTAAKEEMANMLSPATLLKSGFDSLTSSLSDTLATFAQTGKMDFGAMIQGMLKNLQIMAAGKTAEFLMLAAYEELMVFIDSSSAGLHQAKAAAAWTGAIQMGAFVLGSGLAGMAHSGIDSVPENGTWLLKKKERVVDAKTNQDLKEYLKGGGNKQSINMPITINGGDEKSVLKALPQLREMILNTVSSDISSGGRLNGIVRAYTS